MFSKRHKKLLALPSSNRTLYSVILLHSLLLLFAQLQYAAAELRFCLTQLGPQRMKDSDCPGGFVFKEPAKPTGCKFYNKTGEQAGKVLSGPTNLCEPDTDRVIEHGDQLDDMDAFTYFMWEDPDLTNVDQTSDDNNTLGNYNPTECEMDCLAEWEDPHFVTDEEPIPDDFDESKVNDPDKAELKKLTKEMFLLLLMDDDKDDNDITNKVSPLSRTVPSTGNATLGGKGLSTKQPYTATSQATDANQSNGIQQPNGGGGGTEPIDAQPLALRNSENTKPPSIAVGQSFLHQVLHDSSILHVIKVLSKSMQIVISGCAPFISNDFMEQVLKGMIYISRKMEHTFLDLSPDLYEQISRVLDHCGSRRQQDFFLNGSRCGEKSVVEGFYLTKYKEFVPHQLKGWSYRWGRWHPLLDAAWSIIDFVHSFCFESFMQDLMMLHVYEMSLEGLFPEKVQMLWRIVPSVNQDNFWNNLMQTYDLNITMRNLDACQQGALKMSPFKKHLPRPFLTLAELEKPPPPPSLRSEARKGWNKTVEKYWERYDNLGGFPAMSEEFGTCFTEAHFEEEEAMIDDLKKKCAK